MYLPGIAFLFVTGAVISVPIIALVKSRSLAVLLSVCASTFILKPWAYLSMGGYDLALLIILIVIGSCAAVVTLYNIPFFHDILAPILNFLDQLISKFQVDR